jgi:hypothetical protein
MADTTAFTSAQRRCFHGELMIYLRSTEEAGECKLTVSADHMKEETLLLRAAECTKE